VSEDARLRIRPAAPADCAAICKLIHELAVYERAPEHCHATPHVLEERLFGSRPYAEAVVAEWDGAVAGFALWFHNFSTWECAPGLYLEDLYVRQTFRRFGIGKAMLAHLAAIAVQRGCKRFEWAVLDWNKPAREFYESLGARAMDEWVPYRMEGEALRELAASAVPLPAPAPAATKSAKPAPRKSLTYKPATTAAAAFEIWTDGGAEPNPGTGAWACVITGDEDRELCGGELGTTNNRMEMTAAIRALEAVPAGAKVTVHTDSEYVKKGITTWIKGWKAKGWKSRTGLVKNRDLWQRLDALSSDRRVTWEWTRGHAGDVHNERCDALCEAKIAEMIAGSTPAQRKTALEQEKSRQEREAKGTAGDLFG